MLHIKSQTFDNYFGSKSTSEVPHELHLVYDLTLLLLSIFTSDWNMVRKHVKETCTLSRTGSETIF